jgi:hypothetical protein
MPIYAPKAMAKGIKKCMGLSVTLPPPSLPGRLGCAMLSVTNKATKARANINLDFIGILFFKV